MEHMQKYKIEDESFNKDENEEEINQNNNSNIIPNQSDVILTNSNNNFGQLSKINNENENLNQILQKNTNSQNLNNNILEVNLSNMDLNDNDLSNIPQPSGQNESNHNQETYHHVQIIDEDVENFKRRLDIMIKNFRTDTLKDFMSIKRNLLIEQKSVIESERQKCDALLSTKSDLIEHLKDDLAKTQKLLNSQIIIKERINDIIFRQKFNSYSKKLKSLAFYNVLKKYHDKKKLKKDKEKKIKKRYNDNLKHFIFDNLKRNWKEMKIYKIVSAKEKECQDKLNEMAQYYGKEISDLRNKLSEANIKNEQLLASRNLIQENLKKVVMRGVMAMNMEAMNVLDTNQIKTDLVSNTASNIVNDLNLTGNIQNKNNNINNKTINSNNNQFQVNQSFQPNNEILINNTNNINNINNNNPVVKDANWVNASSVPMNMKNNLLINSNNEEYNLEIHDTEHADVFNDNDLGDDLNSRPYNLIPTNPVERNYIQNNNFPQDIQPISHFPQNNSQSYYDEMQKNLANIKNEFSAIKQSPGSMMEEDSFNNSGFMNPSYQQQNIFNMNMNNMNNVASKISNYSTVSNTNIMVNNKNISNSNINNSIKKNVNVGNNNINNNKKKPLVAPSGPSVTVNNNKQNIISKGINKTSSKKVINKK